MSLLLYMSATNSSSDTSVSVISVSIPLAFLLLLTSSSACKKSNYIDLWQPADPLWSMAPWCLMSFPIYHAILGLIVKNFSYVRYVWKIFLLFLSKRYDRISLHNRTSCIYISGYTNVIYSTIWTGFKISSKYCCVQIWAGACKNTKIYYY